MVSGLPSAGLAGPGCRIPGASQKRIDAVMRSARKRALTGNETYVPYWEAMRALGRTGIEFAWTCGDEG